jgi:hypothetical protein
LVFEKNAIFSAENWQKSLKIVIITSTPYIDQMRDGEKHRIIFLGINSA